MAQPTDVYVGPTLVQDRPGSVGLAKGTRGWVIGEGPTADLVEFIPTWGDGWLSMYVSRDHVREIDSEG